jgi:hypothetical protein
MRIQIKDRGTYKYAVAARSAPDGRLIPVPVSRPTGSTGRSGRVGEGSKGGSSSAAGRQDAQEGGIGEQLAAG